MLILNLELARWYGREHILLTEAQISDTVWQIKSKMTMHMQISDTLRLV